MKKVILAGVAALGLSACCGSANAAILEIADLSRLERSYTASEVGRGNNEYEYINTMFETSFTALNPLSLEITHSYYREIRDNTFQIEFNSTSNVSIWQGYEEVINDTSPENVPNPHIIALMGLGLLGFSCIKRLTSKSYVVK